MNKKMKEYSQYEKDQHDLDRYLRMSHTKEEIGKFYERYIGYLFENENYRVTYTGIRDELEDKGRDLIAKKGNEILVIQCKNWSQKNLIREKHIYQLFGTTSHIQLENPQKKVNAIFITTSELSAYATQASEALNVQVRIIPFNKNYPLVKCNINKKGKLYHLPFDDEATYDNIEISRTQGEYFVKTIDEAIKLGFESPKLARACKKIA